ncbi:S8 family serine peptidase [Candidatus Methylospira mobilis]|uniref:S8 family serine peptidase n=1 Tax=Candidatus Methylospira mobilis TaxID=1808979 RepID=A0A5Q0BGQ0_9GAMM|nr:S8 family serine peptidase [Candidatus Methylospira mobilis]QFY41391.1 S8 family serine peptidase [Candidatus Methylospira mobilis]
MLNASFFYKVNTNQGYELIGYTSNGWLVENFYNASGALLEQDVFAGNSEAKFITNAQGGYTESIFVNGVLTASGTFNANNVLLSQTQYAANGHTVIETDTFSYNSRNQLTSEIRANANGVFETETFTYSNNQLSSVIHSNAGGVVTEIDYYSNGHLTQVIHPVTPTKSPTTAPTTNPSTPVSTGWSSTSGLGEISVLKALDLATGQTLADAAPAQPVEWGISSAKFQDAWAAGFTGKGVVIADIDTGVDLNNAALTHNLSQYDWNFVGDNANVQDDNGHGSFTASELAAAANSSNNVVGGAYGAQMMILKALDASGSGSDGTIATAITYAVNHGANVINMSLGGASPDATLQAALQYAASQGVVVAIAAGNSGASSPAYPAAYAQTVSDVIAVGATQQSGSSLSLAGFSNHAGSATPYNFVDAPGVNLQGYNNNGQVVTDSGTSMATPLVAAEAAVVEQAIATVHPEYSAAQIAALAVSDITQSATALSLIGVASTTAHA